MKTQKSKIYANYPNQPYISLDRDLARWEAFPEKFHYGIVPKANMELLEEGLFPGDIVMLWRIHFNNFTNQSVIPEYFEYRYGIDSHASLDRLFDRNLIRQESLLASLDLSNVTILKRLLKFKNLPLSGKKNDVLQRVVDNFSEEELSEHLNQRRYAITQEGDKVLAKYDYIIKKHGPKSL